MQHPRIGVHVSIAGGIDKAPERAAQEQCEVFQCFTRSPQGGKAPELTPELVAQFKENMRTFNIQDFYIHAPYYINFGSTNPATYHSSVRVIREELERGSILGAKYVMAHIGSHTGWELEPSLAQASKGIAKVLEGYTGSTQFLIEISAGAGNVLGDTFEEIAEMLRQIGISTGPNAQSSIAGFGGICFDTCHAFASGYDYRSPEKTKQILEQFDQTIGLNYLKLTHVNDSKGDLGDHKDRHEHVGKGFVGQDGLASLLQSNAFRSIDWLLETENEERFEDVVKLKQIRAK